MKIVYRYEIFAPGGIIVVDSIDNSSLFPEQKEVAFVDGIVPRYIHKVDLFLVGKKTIIINKISNNNATESKNLEPIYDFHIVKGGASVSKCYLKWLKQRRGGVPFGNKKLIVISDVLI